ncbi:MAG: DNA polymerase ligase N-terminal domain-containing protein, partial [Promethearchaeota archaeon]
KMQRKIKFAELNRYIEAKLKKILDFLDRLEKGYRGKFGINAHKAQQYHWDLRIEAPGGDLTEYVKLSGPEDVSKKEKDQRVKNVPKSRLYPKSSFVSFAIPKHKLPASGKNVLIMRTSDHPINYFNRRHPYKIPENFYGSGTVDLEDKGWYEVLDVDKKNKKLKIWLNGKKHKGIFDIVYTGDNKFLLVKEKKQFKTLDDYKKSLNKQAKFVLDNKFVEKISRNYWKQVYKDEIRKWKKFKSRSYYDEETLKEFRQLSDMLKKELKRITIHFKINWGLMNSEERQKIQRLFG